MRELRFQLVKEDYQSWIRWNVARHDSKKMKLVSLALYAVFLVVFLGGNIKAAAGNIQAMIPSILVALVVGAGMMYVVSKKNQERMIWKNSGLLKMEKTGSFPHVIVTIEEKGMTMDVPELNANRYYSYRDLKSIMEIDRLFLVETSDNTCQFIAKSAFADRVDMDEFVTFLQEKIDDAKEHPENYAASGPEGGARPAVQGNGPLSRKAGTAVSEEDDVPEIEPVDTSRMGKIGKMAHIMASADRVQEDDDGPAKADSEEDSDRNDSGMPEAVKEENSSGKTEDISVLAQENAVSAGLDEKSKEQE